MDHARHPRRLGSVFLCALMMSSAWMACQPEPESESQLDLGIGRMMAAVSPKCEGKRWIGIKPDPELTNSCLVYAPSSNWRGDPLFASAGAAQLQRYCLFTWQGPASAPPPAEIAALQTAAATLDGFAEDCPVVMPQGFPEEMAFQQRGAIHDAAGGLALLPAPVPSTLSATRLAVVDNAPDDLGPISGQADQNPLPSLTPHNQGAPLGEHGKVLSYLARDLGCPQDAAPGSGGTKPSCAVHVETALAMGRGAGSNAAATGGLTGTKSELAAAIYRTINDWKDDIANRGEPRLVVNLSLGWEDHAGANDCHVPDPEDLEAPARSVVDSLFYARCHGALVVAAAGNHTGGREPHHGLMCPAHFMQWDAPTDEVCAALVTRGFAARYQTLTSLVLRPPPASGAYDPLVHPIGGLDFGGAPLTPRRPESLPQLVAPALFGVSYEGFLTPVQSGHVLPGTVAPFPLTGTSVAALNVSAIAATAWHYRPYLAPANVMKLLYDNGVNLSTSAVEASRSGSGTAVHRASLCRTLRGMDLLAPSFPCSDPEPLQNNQLPPQNPLPSTATRDLLTGYYSSGATSMTATSTPLAPGATPLNTLFTQAAGDFVGPLPFFPSCPTCVIQLGASGSPIILYLEPTAGTTLSNVVVVADGQAFALTGQPNGSIATKTKVTLSGGANLAIGSDDRVFLTWESSESSGYQQLQIVQ